MDSKPTHDDANDDLSDLHNATSPDLPTRPPVIIEAPPSVGKQMIQLVAIPAIIVIICIVLAVLFTMLAGEADSVDTHLRRLRNPGGLYHDRARAAAHLNQIIVELEDEQQKREIATALTDILANSVNPDEKELIASLVIAQGRLGQEGGLQAALSQSNSPHPIVRHAVCFAVVSWPDRQAAQSAIPTLIDILSDPQPRPAMEAARALGTIAPNNDPHTIAALQSAMQQMGIERREVRWNAAIALARLGDEQGGNFVADVLLDRETLSQLPVDPADGATGRLDEQTQTQVILASLAAATTINNEKVWAKIKSIAEADPNIGVRNTAKQIIASRGNK